MSWNGQTLWSQYVCYLLYFTGIYCITWGYFGNKKYGTATDLALLSSNLVLYLGNKEFKELPRPAVVVLQPCLLVGSCCVLNFLFLLLVWFYYYIFNWSKQLVHVCPTRASEEMFLDGHWAGHTGWKFYKWRVWGLSTQKMQRKKLKVFSVILNKTKNGYITYLLSWLLITK